MSPAYLNIGCGKLRPEGWVNADFLAAYGVLQVDVRRPLPFPDAAFDAVYHSHLLEHLTPEEGRRFLDECRRILLPGGVLRVVVPDFSDLVDEYLALRPAMAEFPTEALYQRYQWLVVELTDQFSRDASGGAMSRYLSARHDADLCAFLARRAGVRPLDTEAPTTAPAQGPQRSRFARLLGKLRYDNLRDHLIKRLLGPADYDALRIGRFRRSGEVHRWLYDAPSLTYLLHTLGFREVRATTPGESRIAGWSSRPLDLTAAGTPRIPSSLYLEAIK